MIIMHNDEQLGELEALASIYPTELEQISESGTFPIEFSIKAKSDEEIIDDDSVFCTLHVLFPKEYPDVIPEMSLDDFSDNLQDHGEIEPLLERLRNAAAENLGMVMCFTLISHLQEELHQLREKYLRLREEEKEARKQKEEEAERKKLEGTAVTIENFMAWKLKFDEEMRQSRLKQGLVAISDKNNRPTGREQFLKDADLCTSDIRLIEETGEEIKIDESLFDDLDINDQDLMSDDEED